MMDAHVWRDLCRAETDDVFEYIPVGSYVFMRWPAQNQRGVIYRVLKHWPINSRPKKGKFWNSETRKYEKTWITNGVREVSLVSAFDMNVLMLSKKHKKTTMGVEHIKPLDIVLACHMRSELDTIVQGQARMFDNVPAQAETQVEEEA